MSGIYIDFSKLPQVSTEVSNPMDVAAGRLSRDKGVNFEILKFNSKKIFIVTYQAGSKSDKELTSRELKEMGVSFFTRYFKGYSIDSDVRTLIAHKIHQVDVKWIQEKMGIKKLTATELSDNLGIDVASINAWLDGSKDLTQTVKAMFYFYLHN